VSDRILVVDDDDAFRRTIVEYLTEAAFEVARAHNYADALDVLDDGKPIALLLTDIVLPKVNGFALARMARMRHLGLSVIYMTGFDVPTEEARGPVMRKPFELKMLLAQIRMLLGAPDQQ
jgi:DNA-binding response OmpR family regulator